MLLIKLSWWHPSVVHIQWFRIPHFDYFMVRLLQCVFKIKVVYTAHNILPHQGNENKNTDVFCKAYHTFDSIIVHSLITKSEIVKTFNVDSNKIEVIRHGILPFDISDEQYNACLPELDEKYASLRGKTVFSALGFQNFYKGTDLLARVWAETPELRDNKEAMLLIIGKVNAADMDLSMLEGINNVIFDNRRIPDEEFVYLLRHTNVYLLPYREISQSGAMLTVLTEHIPLLVTDVGALAEPLSIAHMGWKMQRADEQVLRKALLHLLAHQDEIKAIRNDHQSWEKVCSFYNWQDISKKTQLLYESLRQSTLCREAGGD
jgi:glycosyltransferase involved in cell wall biosynthesis